MAGGSANAAEHLCGEAFPGAWPDLEETMPEIAHNPWIRTAVRCLASSRASERPISFLLGDSEVEIRAVLESWREPDYLYFRVEMKDGGVYEIRYHEYEYVWEVRESTHGAEASGSH